MIEEVDGQHETVSGFGAIVAFVVYPSFPSQH